MQFDSRPMTRLILMPLCIAIVAAGCLPMLVFKGSHTPEQRLFSLEWGAVIAAVALTTLKTLRFCKRRWPAATNTFVGLLVLLVVIAIYLPDALHVAEHEEIKNVSAWTQNLAKAEDRFFRSTGQYSDSIVELGLPASPPKDFEPASLKTTPDGWAVSFTRRPGKWNRFGNYVVAFEFPRCSWSCDAQECPIDEFDDIARRDDLKPHHPEKKGAGDHSPAPR